MTREKLLNKNKIKSQNKKSLAQKKRKVRVSPSTLRDVTGHYHGGKRALRKGTLHS
jgi:hypothetical protein